MAPSCSACGNDVVRKGDTGPFPNRCPSCKAAHRAQLQRENNARNRPLGPLGAVCVCRFCGREFVHATRTATICPDIDCRRARRRERGTVWRAQREGADDPCSTADCHRPAFIGGMCRRHYKQSRTGSVLVERFACANCGKDSTPGLDGVSAKATRFCSTYCKRQQMRDLRRVSADAFVAPVSRPAVFERDGWICKLCGIPVDRNAAWPSPLFPTLDHIIPLSRGGTHEPANAQTAHFRCNVTKGSRTLIRGEQLALIG